MESRASCGWLPSLLQITDSAYPTGAFAHSGGLEGLVQAGQVGGEADLEHFLRTSVFDGLEKVQLPVLRLSREATIQRDADRLAELDELAAAALVPEELRLASSRSGRQRLDLLEQVMGCDHRYPADWPVLSGALRRTQLPVVAGLEAALLGIPEDTALEAFAFAAVSGTLSAALKIMRLGQTALQAMLYRLSSGLPALAERSRRVDPGRIGTFTPLLDIASARHRHAESRLFLS